MGGSCGMLMPCEVIRLELPFYQIVKCDIHNQWNGLINSSLILNLIFFVYFILNETMKKSSGKTRTTKIISIKDFTDKN